MRHLLADEASAVLPVCSLASRDGHAARVYARGHLVCLLYRNVASGHILYLPALDERQAMRDKGGRGDKWEKT